MSKRIKTKLPEPITREEAEAAVNEIARALNNKRKLVARMDAAKLEIDQRNAMALADCDMWVKKCTARVQAWAQVNPEAFAKRKSVEFAAGTVGFRTGTPKLKLLNRTWSWEKVLEAAQQYLPNFLRSKPELDKEAIIAQRDELEEFLPQIGVKVDQDEAFYVEPKLTEPESRVKEAA